ncbi:MAG: BlaI/MecI/CopY family transcriptional regulator [Planctomycetota bacterium]|nr:BlaI/MecI/CopY family transcriptional regulator [Planctomycetota bacterium]
MTDLTNLSRRERQIMEILFADEAATVMQVVAKLPKAPSDKAVRRMLQILEEKGYVQRRKVGREFQYRPVQSRKRAAVQSLQRLLDTFFNGAIDEAFAVHLGTKNSNISDEQLTRMLDLIQDARQKGR